MVPEINNSQLGAITSHYILLDDYILLDLLVFFSPTLDFPNPFPLFSSTHTTVCCYIYQLDPLYFYMLTSNIIWNLLLLLLFSQGLPILIL